MNFKPTKLKFVISIIVAFIVGILFLSRIPCLDCSAEEMRALSNQQFLIGFIVSLFLVYSIWSLFQKKKDKKAIKKAQYKNCVFFHQYA